MIDKESYEKGEQAGFEKGVKTACRIIKDCERDPKDITKLSLKVISELSKLVACD